MKDRKVLLVTGASSAVGKQLIRRVANEYSAIIAHYRSSKEDIDSICREYDGKIIPLQADFSDINSTKTFIDEVVDLGLFPDHIVHLPSGKIHNMQFHKQAWDSFQKELDISFRSIVMICQHFVPYMAKQKYGKIVFMLSAYLVGVPPKFESPYITTKYALLGLMKTLSAEYSAKRVMVNAVSPDMMDTDLISDLPDLIKEQSAKNNPLGRNILVSEVLPTIE